MKESADPRTPLRPDGKLGTADSGNSQKRGSGEQPRDKPVEEEADKDIKRGN